jgi:phosphoglycerol transferase MdoB-like AlkP superfamily enzyme
VPISAEEDALISTNLFLNDLTVNGVFSLKEAFAERRRIAADTPEAAGYTAPEGQQSLERASLTLPAYSRRELQDLLLAKTPPSEFLKKNPPHVVFLQVESLSNYYLDLHSPTLNLLGSLEKQLPDCIVFRNFLSSGNGTIKSLEALMVNNPKGFLFEAHSAFLENSLSSSAALPFLKAGYHTSFITGGDLGFYQMGKFIPKQYFQTVEGSETLLAEIKNAEAGTWGVHDEFLFERIFSKLEQSKGKPQFIYAMTISNHTPFDLPKGYKPYPVQIPSELLKAIKTNEAIAVKNFTAYQYGADCLGRFLERLRRSPYADNTIVVATGDHNTLQLFNFSYTELLQKLSVPLIMYVPKKYLPPGDINTKRFGSHKDIFPTIYYLSLPGATYLKSGDNLLDPALSSTDLFAINDSSVAMNRYGCVLVQKKPLYYKWQKDHPNLLEPTTRLRTPELAHLLSEAQAYVSSLSAYIQSDLGK